MTGILEALRDPEFRAGILANARSALNGTLHGITTGVLGAPSDLLSMFKYNTLMGGEPTKIPLGSEQLGNYAEQAGILPPRENNISYKAGEFLGPIAAMGVPKAVSAAGDVVGNALGDLAAHQGPAAQFGMVGYHGTPHRFAPTPDNPLGAFDLSKIGTGEGAQAYGHGIYIAENPGVANGYRSALSNTLDVIGDASPLEKRAAQMALTFGDNTPDGAIKWLGKFEGKGANHVAPAMTPELVQSVKSKFENGTFKSGGALYHVDLPDEHIANMLDWDKPLSEQAPHIQEAARKLIPGEFASSGAMQDARWGDLASAYDPMQMSGGDFLGRLTSVFGRAVDNPMNASPRASMELNKLGIPGIKYLDAGSRDFVPPRIESGANGHTVYWGNDPSPVGTFKSLEEAQSAARDLDTRTRNFVVFDPSILNILKRE